MIRETHCKELAMWLWWIGNAVLLVVVVPVVLLLANRVMRPALEIKRYADDILDHGVGLTKNLEPVPAVAETRDLVSAAKGLAVRYVTAAGPLL
jgi:hypothetical protein